MKRTVISLALALLLGMGCGAAAQMAEETLPVEEYAMLPEAGNLWNVYPADLREITVSAISREEIGQLSKFPRLETIHANGCRDFEALFALQEMGYQVLRPVVIGGESYNFDITKLTLTDVSAQELRDALPCLPRLKQVRLVGTLPPAETLLGLREAYPDISFHWDVTLGGKVWMDAVQWMSLQDIDLTQEADIAGALSRLPGLSRVNLTGTGLSQEEMMALCDAFPQVFFLWQIDLGAVTVPTDITRLDLSNTKFDSVEAVEHMLRYLPKLEWVDLSFCGLADEDLDALNRRHEDMRVVWTVTIDRVRVRTDATTFMPVKQKDWIETRHIYPLRYCTDMVCVDIGHMAVDNCEWAAFMPNLEYLILGETRVTDLSPLSGLKKLKFLELFTIAVKDYSPLLGCTALEDLNLGLTYGDPAPIGQMKWLKHLWWCDAASRNFQYWEEAAKLPELLPDTEIKFRIDHPTASGWRRIPNYYAMRDVLEMPYFN